MHLIALSVIAVCIVIRDGGTKLGQCLAAERNNLEAIVNLHYLVKLRQIEVNEAGTVGEAVM